MRQLLFILAALSLLVACTIGYDSQARAHQSLLSGHWRLVIPAR